MTSNVNASLIFGEEKARWQNKLAHMSSQRIRWLVTTHLATGVSRVSQSDVYILDLWKDVEPLEAGRGFPELPVSHTVVAHYSRVGCRWLPVHLQCRQCCTDQRALALFGLRHLLLRPLWVASSSLNFCIGVSGSMVTEVLEKGECFCIKNEVKLFTCQFLSTYHSVYGKHMHNLEFFLLIWSFCYYNSFSHIWPSRVELFGKTTHRIMFWGRENMMSCLLLVQDCLPFHHTNSPLQ